jgi:hypothetical protein
MYKATAHSWNEQAKYSGVGLGSVLDKLTVEEYAALDALAAEAAAKLEMKLKGYKVDGLGIVCTCGVASYAPEMHAKYCPLGEKD